MASKAASPAEYIAEQPAERQAALKNLQSVINKNLPKGFKEEITYGMLGWVVPHSKYPDGYHCKPEQPLPFLNVASQKNFIALYHMGLYADKATMDWFVSEYPKHVPSKLDMGKSCIRFKKIEQIPYDLIGELITRFSPDSWIQLYEQKFKK